RAGGVSPLVSLPNVPTLSSLTRGLTPPARRSLSLMMESPMNPHPHPHRFVLRDLPRSARLVIAAFLIPVGLAYASAMVHLRCHQKDGDDANAAQYPLDTWEQIRKYSKFDPTPGAMSLEKLTQSTHVHLLGFAMLYALTGFVFAFTRYPAWLRALLAPLVLI